MNPLFSIGPESVAIVEAHDKAQILVALAGVFARAYGLDAAQVLEHLEERERLGSTGFGRGCGHCASPSVEMISLTFSPSYWMTSVVLKLGAPLALTPSSCR